MSYYLVTEPMKNKATIFVANAEELEIANNKGLPFFSYEIGDELLANERFEKSKNEIILNYKSQMVHFVKCNIVDGHEEWSACDIFNEAENTESMYKVYDQINGGYLDAKGLEEAKNLDKFLESAILKWAGSDEIKVLNNIPMKKVIDTQVEVI